MTYVIWISTVKLLRTQRTRAYIFQVISEKMSNMKELLLRIVFKYKKVCLLHSL